MTFCATDLISKVHHYDRIGILNKTRATIEDGCYYWIKLFFVVVVAVFNLSNVTGGNRRDGSTTLQIIRGES